MVELTSEKVFSLLEERGAAGLATAVLNTSTVPRTEEKCKELIKKISSFRYQSIVTFSEWFDGLVMYDELICITFMKFKPQRKDVKDVNKTKPNAVTVNIGGKEATCFPDGLYYYVASPQEDGTVPKVYCHFNKGKRQLLDCLEKLNAQALQIKVHNIIPVYKNPYVYIFSFDIFDGEKLVAHCGFYFGHPVEKN